MVKAADVYMHRSVKYSTIETRLRNKLYRIQNWRLTAAAVGVACSVITYRFNVPALFWLSLLIFAALFVYLLVVHNKVLDVLRHVFAIKRINEEGLLRLEGKWVDFGDEGNEFRDGFHEYSHDLDIFGKESLFQWINTAKTDYGRTALRDLLANPCLEIKAIYDRQQAIIELGLKRWWRQKYQVEAAQIVSKMRDVTNLLLWARSSKPLYSKKEIVVVIRLLPLLTALSFLFAFGLQMITPIIPILALFLQFFLYYLGVITLNKDLNSINKYQKNICVYGKMLEHFEKAQFTSVYMNTLKGAIKNNKGRAAYQQLRTLQTLVDRISSRENLFFVLINIILLWDYQCMVDLERWKQSSGHLVQKWLHTLGEIEALSSLAIISFDYPHWTFPKITSQQSVFRAHDFGHPLLTNKQVCNDISIEDPKNILLITGSNMSGKSTILRAAGVNLILAYAGAPVCAQEFHCSLMRLYTCMRVSDNLEKGISGFYAELLCIKEILKATHEDHQVFFLLDEIFKGTNSHDRHIGAKMLITKLYKQNSIGLVSTHDLELGELEKESKGKIANYHFQEYYKDNQIFFDFKLRKGVSTTRNALYLMKMAGIE